MSWNHRVLYFEDPNEPWFEIHEVYYDIFGKPNGYAEGGCSTHRKSMKSMRWVIKNMLKCLNRPILYGGDRFPEQYIPIKDESIS